MSLNLFEKFLDLVSGPLSLSLSLYHTHPFCSFFVSPSSLFVKVVLSDTFYTLLLPKSEHSRNPKLAINRTL